MFVCRWGLQPPPPLLPPPLLGTAPIPGEVVVAPANDVASGNVGPNSPPTSKLLVEEGEEEEEEARVLSPEGSWDKGEDEEGEAEASDVVKTTTTNDNPG